MAAQSFRSNPFHTFLSILGIIIGVGALFSILSLADGIEKMGRDQITSTSSLQSLAIQSKQHTYIDQVMVELDSVEYFNAELALALQDSLQDSRLRMNHVKNIILSISGDTTKVGAQKIGLLDVRDDTFSKDSLLVGRLLDSQDIEQARKETLINLELGTKYFPDLEPSQQVGKMIEVGEESFRVAGVFSRISSHSQDPPQMIVPIKTVSEKDLEENPALVIIDVATIESFEPENEIIQRFLDRNFGGGSEGFTIISYADRMKQLTQGMLVFRIVMGMIVGISVLVGGIGVMNVLLMSINDRTREIGVRKAIGGSQKYIRWQFLIEALLISCAGCFLGVVLGVTIMSIAVPLLQHYTEMPFGWVFSLQSCLVIVTVALLIGVIFGFYPAAKAAKLDPIDAIRHE